MGMFFYRTSFEYLAPKIHINCTAKYQVMRAYHNDNTTISTTQFYIPNVMNNTALLHFLPLLMDDKQLNLYLRMEFGNVPVYNDTRFLMIP